MFPSILVNIYSLYIQPKIYFDPTFFPGKFGGPLRWTWGAKVTSPCSRGVETTTFNVLVSQPGKKITNTIEKIKQKDMQKI